MRIEERRPGLEREFAKRIIEILVDYYADTPFDRMADAFGAYAKYWIDKNYKSDAFRKIALKLGKVAEEYVRLKQGEASS